MNEKEYVPAPITFPSATGVGIEELVEYVGKLESREETLQELKSALIGAERQENPLIIFLIAEWGEGKTSIYEVFLRKWAKENNAVTFMISSDKLLNYLEKIVEGKYVPLTSSSAYQLMSAILAALRESVNMHVAEKLPFIGKYNDAREYVSRFLDKLDNIYPDKKFILFIDEFENIMHRYSRAQIYHDKIAGRVVEECLQGIVQIANNEIPEIGITNTPERKRGKYLGRVFFIFTITPWAWYEIRKDRNLAAIVGRFREGRIVEIKLKPINMLERIQFVRGIIDYSYNRPKANMIRKIFKIVPLVNSLLVSTLGNISNLQTAIFKVITLSMASSRDLHKQRMMSKICVSQMLDCLEKLEISVFGQSTPLFNTSLFEKINNYWEYYIDRCVHINRELAKTMLPLSMLTIILDPREIANKLDVSPYEIEQIINELQIFMKPETKAGLLLGRPQKALYEVFRVKINPDKIYKTIIQNTSEIIQEISPIMGTEEIRREYLAKLIDNFVYLDYDGSPAFFFTDNLDELTRFLTEASEIPLDEISAQKLAFKIFEILDETLSISEQIDRSRKLFLLSPRIVKIMYISPELLYLDFIQDRIKRLDMWRKCIERDKNDLNHLINTFLVVMNRDGIKMRRVIQSYSSDHAAIYVIEFEAPYKFRGLIYATFTELANEDLEYLDSIIRKLDKNGRHPHIAILIYFSGERIDERFIQNIEKKYFTKIVKIRIPSFLTSMQMIALSKIIYDIISSSMGYSTFDYLYEYLIALVDTKMQLTIRDSDLLKTLQSEINVLRVNEIINNLVEEFKVRELIDEALRREPITIVEDPKLEAMIDGEEYTISNPRELVGSLRYLLVYRESEGPLDEIYRYATNNYMRYHKYGGKEGILSPDIESVREFKKYIYILKENGFIELKSDKDGKILTTIDEFSPLERTIRAILESLRKRSLDLNAYKEYLVCNYKHPDSLLINIISLSYRGLIETTETKKSGNIQVNKYIDLSELEKICNNLSRNLKEYLEENYTILKNIGYIIMFKKRSWRAFKALDLFDFIERTIREVKGNIQIGINLELTARLIKSTCDLFEYFKKYWDSDLKEAYSTIMKIRRKLNEVRGEIRELSESLERFINKHIIRGASVSIRLKEYEKINEALKDHIDDKGLYFKQNITYTICLALSLYRERNKIKKIKGFQFFVLVLPFYQFSCSLFPQFFSCFVFFSRSLSFPALSFFFKGREEKDVEKNKIYK